MVGRRQGQFPSEHKERIVDVVRAGRSSGLLRASSSRLNRRFGTGSRRLYKCGNHLTIGLAEVKVYVAGFTSFLAAFFRCRAEDLVGIPALKTS